MNIDIGQNTTGLIQQLAAQIGITVDKLFPLYVKQVMIEGYFIASLISFFLIVSIILIVFGCIKGKFEENGYSVIAGMGSFILLCITIYLLGDGTTIYSKIYNPEYQATKRIIEHISHLKNGK